METPTPQTIDRTPEQIAIDLKFEAQEKRFVENETQIATLREFFKKHRETISPFQWTCYGWNDCKIKFDCNFGNKDQQKQIARAFGATGWTRLSGTCGQINWHKTVDGCQLIIEGAEHINPKLIEEVKL